MRTLLSTEDCIHQLKLYAESNDGLGNSERAQGFKLSVEFLELYHIDLNKDLKGIDFFDKNDNG